MSFSSIAGLVGQGRRALRSKRLRRAGVVIWLAVFLFQFSLSLLLHPMSQILCLEELTGASTEALHDHNHEHAVVSDTQSEPESESLQHCKDVLYGITQTPMQAFTLPWSPASHVLIVQGTVPAQPFDLVVDQYLPPPFQPPRA